MRPRTAFVEYGGGALTGASRTGTTPRLHSSPALQMVTGGSTNQTALYQPTYEYRVLPGPLTTPPGAMSMESKGMQMELVATSELEGAKKRLVDAAVGAAVKAAKAKAAKDHLHGEEAAAAEAEAAAKAKSAEPSMVDLINAIRTERKESGMAPEQVPALDQVVALLPHTTGAKWRLELQCTGWQSAVGVMTEAPTATFKLARAGQLALDRRLSARSAVVGTDGKCSHWSEWQHVEPPPIHIRQRHVEPPPTHIRQVGGDRSTTIIGRAAADETAAKVAAEAAAVEAVAAVEVRMRQEAQAQLEALQQQQQHALETALAQQRAELSASFEARLADREARLADLEARLAAESVARHSEPLHAREAAESAARHSEHLHARNAAGPVHPARYSIVDLSEAATPQGGAIDIVEDLEDAEKYYTDVTKGKQAPQKDRPRLIIMYGPPGCGKSYALKELYRLKGWSPEEFVHLDPDECRMYCREYRLCISGAHAAKLQSVQEEYGDRLKPTKWISPDGKFEEDGFTVDGHYLALSSATMRSQFLVRKKMLWPHKEEKMTDAFVDRAFVAGYHVVYDTMGKEPDKFLRELMSRARRNHNYQVFVCGCFAPWEMVYSRGRMRALETGRDVNAGFALEQFENIFRRANGQLRPGEVDRSHHDRFEKELREGDELFLFDHSVQDEDLKVALHSVKGSDDSSRDGEFQLEVQEQQQEVEPDPLDADTLLKHFDSSNPGKSDAPVQLCVEECSAMLNAQTRMRTTIDELAHQLKEMKKMGTELMRKQDLSHHKKDITKLEKKISEKTKDLEELEKRYPERRDNTISQYTPLLSQSVFRFDAAYEKLRKKEKQRIEKGAPAIKEDALEHMKVRCEEVNKLKVDMVQPLAKNDFTDADDALNTLLALIHKAKKAVPVLKEVMDAVQSHVEKTCQECQDEKQECQVEKGKVTLEGPSIKGVPRCCAKVAEEYAGNYRKLCDLVRCTLVFPSLHAMAVALSFLTDGGPWTGDDQHKGYQGVSPHLSRAIVCRAKDRMKPDFDARKAGGNRDILLNLWLKLEDSDWILAELQLHVKPLFDLKHRLHVLYKGARILGALEPETVEHQGQLTAQALDRAGRGIVLHLKCSNSTLDEHQEKLQELLQKDECPLLELSLKSFSAVWQNAWKGEKKPYWPPITKDSLRQSRKMNDFNCSLHDLLIKSDDQQLHCRRLRTLDLKGRGLHGTLPEKLATCIEMETLHLGYNSLKGMIPRAFKFMTKLKNLSLNYCELTGELPAELGELKNLERLCLDNNKLTGCIPSRFGGLSGVEKEKMNELAKQKKEAEKSGSKMGKDDEARLKELTRLHKEAGLTKLKGLFLNDNQLSGAIPDTLANCRALERVDLTNNRLTGTVPPVWLVEKQWPKLEFFWLYNNEHMTQDSGRLEQLEQIARDGDAYWKRVVDESKWRTVRLEASRSPSRSPGDGPA